jgi:DNA-binding response OmpR family regulator
MFNGVPVNGASMASKIVLGVDDAPENLFLLQATLRNAGYTFIGAKSGLECLSLVNRVIPRLILLDIEMPDMTGFDTCRRLRENRELRHVPIAFLTARKTPQDVTKGLDAGGNDFLVKPFDPAKLWDRVRHWTTRSIGSAAPAVLAR